MTHRRCCCSVFSWSTRAATCTTCWRYSPSTWTWPPSSTCWAWSLSCRPPPTPSRACTWRLCWSGSSGGPAWHPTPCRRRPCTVAAAPLCRPQVRTTRHRTSHVPPHVTTRHRTSLHVTTRHTACLCCSVGRSSCVQPGRQQPQPQPEQQQPQRQPQRRRQRRVAHAAAAATAQVRHQVTSCCCCRCQGPSYTCIVFFLVLLRSVLL